MERSEEGGSSEKKLLHNFKTNINDFKVSSSCILSNSHKSNQFVSLKSKIEGFFTKRSCEVFILKKTFYLKFKIFFLQKKRKKASRKFIKKGIEINQAKLSKFVNKNSFLDDRWCGKLCRNCVFYGCIIAPFWLKSKYA